MLFTAHSTVTARYSATRSDCDARTVPETKLVLVLVGTARPTTLHSCSTLQSTIST